MCRPIAWHGLVLLGLGLTFFAGCGDDDDAPLAGAGGKDGGRTLPRDAGMRRDGAVEHDAGGAGASEPAPMCPVGECDLLDPDSCGAGEGCIFARGVADEPEPPGTLYCGAVGGGGEGDPCMERDDCGPGLDCSASDGTGRCRSYCCALSRTLDCPEGQFCRVGLDLEDESSAVGLCDRCDGCDPLDPDACDAGLSCYPLPGSIDCTACLPPGEKEPGEACTLSTDCESGSACFRFDDEKSLCVEFCEFDSEEPCSDPSRRCSAVAGAKLPVGVALCL